MSEVGRRQGMSCDHSCHVTIHDGGIVDDMMTFTLYCNLRDV